MTGGNKAQQVFPGKPLGWYAQVINPAEEDWSRGLHNMVESISFKINC